MFVQVRPIRVVPDEGPLNGSLCVCVCVCVRVRVRVCVSYEQEVVSWITGMAVYQLGATRSHPRALLPSSIICY